MILNRLGYYQNKQTMRKILWIGIILLMANGAFAQSKVKKWEEVKSMYLAHQHIFLFTETGRVALDSNEFKALPAKWIKSINLVKLADKDADDVPSSASVFISLKKKYLKKYLAAHPNQATSE